MSRSAKALARVAGFAVIALGIVLAGCGGEPKANEVRFQNVADPGPKPFTAPVDPPAASKKAATAARTDPALEPGTFTSKNTHCDREKLIAELIANSDRRKAWTDVLKIGDDPQSMTAYIRNLKPVVLTEDAHLTSHSFVDGEAKGYQVILRKGAPALSDDSGAPVVHCRSGNPLTKPVQLEAETKCINCPAGYQPTEKISSATTCKDCAEPDPKAPPAEKPTAPPPVRQTDSLPKAKTALTNCKAAKGSLNQCKAEYSAARSLCGKDPLNPLCDSTICFAQMTGFDEACGSYIGEDGIRSVCARAVASANVQECIRNNLIAQKVCTVSPLASSPDFNCRISPSLVRTLLALKCGSDGSRPECTSIQISCAKTPGEQACAPLAGVCDRAPARPDCKGLNDFKRACAKDPADPRCQAPAGEKNLAPNTLKGEEQPDTGTGGGETPTPQDQGGGDETPEGGGQQPGGGGQEPGGAGQQPEAPSDPSGGN